jgi:hypothetical protein
MALKPQQDNGTPDTIGDRSHASLPLLFKSELEEHKRAPRVKARLKRVKAMLEGRDPS